MADKDKIKVMLEVLLKDKNFKKSLKDSENAMRKSSKKQEGFINRIKKSWIGITIVLTAVTLAMKKVTKAAMIQEKAEKTLAAAMKVAGTYTKKAYEHNLEYAKSLQTITTYGDEAILGVQKMLTNFGVEGKMLDKLTKSTLDLAAAKGMDLKAASDLVAKSVGSTTNALTRYGIEVTGAAGSTKRMEMAVDNISKLFGGAAAAEAQTYDGQIKQLSNTFGDAQETIGNAFLPLIGDLVKISKKALEVYIDLPAPLQRTAIAIAGIGVAAVVMVKALKMSITKSAVFASALLTICATYEAIKWAVDKGKKAQLGWQTVLNETNMKKATEDLVEYNKELEEYRKEIGAATGETKKMWLDKNIASAQEKYKKLVEDNNGATKQAIKYLEKETKRLQEISDKWTGYEVRVNNTTNAMEKYNKQLKLGKEIEKTKGDGDGGGGKPKGPITDYYAYVDNQRQLDLLKENEAYAKALEAIGENNKKKKELELLHAEAIAEIKAEHDVLDQEKTVLKNEEEQMRRETSLALYGEYYKDLDAIQQAAVNKQVKTDKAGNDAILKAHKAFEITRKEASDAFVGSFLSGIDSMKSSSKDVIVSMVKQFFSMIAGKLAALSAFFFASLNIPAGAGALAAAGLVKAMGGTVAASIAGFSEGGKVAYAAAGFRPQGSDTVPAMLTPGEVVLSVKQTNAFEELMKSIAMPSAGGVGNVSNTTNEGDTIINNEFTNNFEGDTVEEMIEFSQNVGVDLFRR